MTKSRKKKQMKLVGLLVIVLILAGAVAAIQLLNKSETEEKATETESSIKVLSLVSSDIGKVSFQNENMKATFQEKGDTWVYEADSDFPTDADTIANMIATAANTTATKKLTIEQTELSKYGFDSPMTTISLFTKSGIETKLTVGRHNITTDEYYLQVNDGLDIYTIGDSLPSAFACDLMDLGIVETIPTLSFYTIQQMLIHNGEHTYRAVNDGNYGKDMVGNTTWYMQEPFQLIRGIVEDQFDDYVEDVTGFAYAKLQAYNATESDYEKYGVGNDCKRVIEFTYTVSDSSETETETTKSDSNSVTKEKKQNKLTIYIGNPDESENYYYSRFVISDGLKVTDSHRIYLVDASQTAKVMNINPLKYIYKHVMYAQLDDLKTLRLTLGDQEYEFEIREVGRNDVDEDGEEETSGGSLKYGTRILEYYLDGKQLDEKKFKEFYHELISLYGNEIIYDQKAVKDGETYMKVHFERLTSGQEFSVIDAEFKSYNSGNYQATVNGVTEMLVSKSDIEDIVKALHNLLEE